MALHVIAKQKDDFDSRLITINRVARVTEGGRRMSFQTVVAVGNRQGQVGLGIAKSADISKAIEKATRRGRKAVLTLPLVNGTIPFSLKSKYKSAQVFLRPARSGGLIVGGVIRHLCELGGVKHINVKILSRTKNPINNARAAMAAFSKMREWEKVRRARQASV